MDREFLKEVAKDVSAKLPLSNASYVTLSDCIHAEDIEAKVATA